MNLKSFFDCVNSGHSDRMTNATREQAKPTMRNAGRSIVSNGPSDHAGSAVSLPSTPSSGHEAQELRAALSLAFSMLRAKLAESDPDGGSRHNRGHAPDNN